MLDWVKITLYNNHYTFDFRCKEKIEVTALEAAHKTINYIISHNPPPYTLYLSGGIDSQAMLYAWLTSGHKFRTFSAVYNNDLNKHDFVTLDQFSNIHNIKINYVDFDLIKFLENEHEEFVYKYYCGSPHITTYMKLLSLTNEGTSLMSGNIIFPIHSNLDDNQMGLYHYATKSRKNIIPFFFLETKELTYGFKIPDLSKCIGVRIGVNNKLIPENKKILFYDLKVQTYRDNGFPVIPQSKNKFTGFEKIKEYYDKSTRKPTIQERLKRHKNQYSNRNFDLFFRNKYEYTMSVYKYNILYNEGIINVR